MVPLLLLRTSVNGAGGWWGGGGGLLRILSDVKTQDVLGSCGVKFWVQGFWGVLLEALGFCLSFNFCPHLIMAVT